MGDAKWTCLNPRLCSADMDLGEAELSRAAKSKNNSRFSSAEPIASISISMMTVLSPQD